MTAKEWEELEKLARQIDPNLPTDLSGYEVTITMGLDFSGVRLRKINEQTTREPPCSVCGRPLDAISDGCPIDHKAYGASR